MITDMELDRFRTHSLQDERLLRILSAALDAVDPFKAVQRYLPQLEGRVFGLGIGKAAVPMLDALVERVPLAGGLAVTKYAPRRAPGLYPVMEGGHPVPDVRSLQAGTRVLEFVSALQAQDTLVCLISGGGSALVTAPYVPLEDLQTLTSLLLASGARIDEINVLRRRLDRLKGGGLARATQARIVSLILSDVIGNPLEAIASGPTAPDPTTAQDALRILKNYGLERQVPASILALLESGGLLPSLESGSLPPSLAASTSSHSQSVLPSVENIIIADNKLAAQAALERAQQEGLRAEILTNELQGEAREVGQALARRLRADSAAATRPFCWIAGGETTVTLQGDGKGGRNQELALAAVPELAGVQDVLLIALASDGDDGPTDAAGAVVTGASARQAELLGLEAAGCLSRNDAYPFFDGLGDLLKTGPTGTNVNDLLFLCAL